MKLYCKCGHCLTKELRKVVHKDAYISEEFKRTYYDVEDEETGEVAGREYSTTEYFLKEGTYHKWKRSSRKGGLWFGSKNVYVVAIPDVLANAVNECQGCCQRDYFDLQCPSCKEIVGNGCDDCWQTARAMLYCRKVRVVQGRSLYNELVEAFEALKEEREWLHS